MTARAKFRVGALLHNRNTKEDGLVTRVDHLLRGAGIATACGNLLGR
jgi:hypothetical protein